MKPTFFKFAALLAVVIFLMPSCKKDPTKTELITTGTWRITASTVTFGTTTTDAYASFLACDKDNVTTFVAGGVIKEDEGATKCSASDPQTNTGTWAFTDNETKLSIIASGATAAYSIVTLDANTLKISQSTTSSGVTYSSTITFAH
jgi:hypothetical protein